MVGNNSFLSLSKKAANLSYTFSLLVLPFYISLYLIKLLADLIEIVSKNQMLGNIFQTLFSVSLGFVANLIASRIMKSFKKKDIKEKVEQLSKNEEKTSSKINELFSLQQYDLVVVQVCKSIELLLTKTFLNLDYSIKDNSILKLITNSYEHKIISKDLFVELKELVKIRNSAVHTESSITKDNAKYAIDTLNNLNQYLAKVTEQCYFCNKTFSITELKSDNVTGAYVCKDCDKSQPNWRDYLMDIGQDP